jgi:hypothetical protein
MTLDLFNETGSGRDQWLVQINRAGAAQPIDGLVVVEGYDPNGRQPEEVSVATLSVSACATRYSAMISGAAGIRPPQFSKWVRSLR